jgi:hypothetical protein
LKIGLALFILTLSPLALAEYRVYQYLVKSKNSLNSVNNAKARPVVSTLNPVAYRAYHGGSSIDLTLMRTWMCVGYTGAGRDVCPAPGDKAATQ